MTYEELEQKLLDNGYGGVILLKDYDYASAFIGVTDDNRAVYEYSKMVDCLMEHEDWTYEAAVEWIDYNTIMALQYMGSKAPLIMYSLE